MVQYLDDIEVLATAELSGIKKVSWLAHINLLWQEYLLL
jgi:hypothetical protein